MDFYWLKENKTFEEEDKMQSLWNDKSNSEVT